ncbi:hypothetical protein C9374_014637 [Naegleria lovaniensis]|uniref:Uncharacterized protein n=1 Tax=Naegleria lovaniensis TaxID=51637 RepID=A0AA88GY61_NAELO|nr:uncharacterized protein C9374_014637 [Naegleria lovaniensis]KAG2389237.1 hypothetical protein C9374_014637 [Naegleria lovaniensis]
MLSSLWINLFGDQASHHHHSHQQSEWWWAIVFRKLKEQFIELQQLIFGNVPSEWSFILLILMLLWILKVLITHLLAKYIIPYVSSTNVEAYDSTLEKEAAQLEKKHIPKAGKRCVIVGGSVSGLLSATVASVHFDHVYIIEKKEMIAGHTMVAHGHQTHILLMRCIQLLDCLLSTSEKSFMESVVELGAFELSIDMADYRTNGIPRVPLNFVNFPNMIMMSRTFMENYLRAHVKKLSNVTIMENTQVEDIVWERYHEEHSSDCHTMSKNREQPDLISSNRSPNSDGMNTTSSVHNKIHPLRPKYYKGNIVHRAVGVKITEPSGKESVIDANLVIDCSGVYTKSPDWISAELSEIEKKVKPFQKTKAKSQITNVMAIFRIKPEMLSEGFYKRDIDGKPQWLCVFTNEFPKPGRVMIYRIENGLAMFIISKLGTFENAQKLRSKESALQFIKTEIPSAYNHCQNCFDAFVDGGDRPVMDWSVYRRDYISFNHWEKLPSLCSRRGKKAIIEGFLALGDSVASLNPYYGRGIALVAESCLALHESLKEARMTKKKSRQKHEYPEAYTFNFNFSRRLQLSFYHLYAYIWFVDYMSDLVLYPQKVTNWFMRKIVKPILSYLFFKSIEACETDQFVFLTMIRFQNMLLSWKTLFFDWRFLWHIFFPSSQPQPNRVQLLGD